MNIMEQRKHQRHIPSAKTFVYTPDSFGRIINISEGGFSLQYIDVESPIRRKEIVDILLGNLSLNRVPVTVVWDSLSESAIKDSLIMSRVGIRFDKLTPQHKAMIHFFISQHICVHA
jgi:hypothetical protein